MLRYGKRLVLLLAAVFCCLLWASAASVTQTQRTNGYVSIAFDVGDGQTAFLTGLTDDIDVITQAANAIVTACTSGESDTTVDNAAFIDAEKVVGFKVNDVEQPDTELCWAASSSNILHYTGWGNKAGFADEDAMFDMFATRFDDVPGRADIALKWFFNGRNKMQETDGWAHQDDGEYGTFKGYLSDYAFEAQTETFDLEDQKDNMVLVAERLNAGYGVALYTGYHDADGERDGGHGLTLWGYIRAADGTFTHLIFADSDDDYRLGGDRTKAANRLHIRKLEQYPNTDEDSWSVFYDEEKGTWQVVESATVLRPYDESIVPDSGTKDCFTTPDLIALDLLIDSVAPTYYNQEADEIYHRPVISVNNDFIFQVLASNISDTDMQPTTLGYRVELFFHGTTSRALLWEGGSMTWGENNSKSGATVMEEGYSQLSGYVSFGKQLSKLAGYEIDVVVTLNPSNDMTEAYYSNNSIRRTVKFVSSGTAGTLDVQLGDMGEQNDGTFGGTATLTKPMNGERYYLFYAFDGYVLDENTHELKLIRFPWRLVYAGDTFPTQQFENLDRSRPNIYYRLLVKPEDGSQPYGEYLSGKLTPRYFYLEVEAHDGNVFNLTTREEGSTVYADGEMTSFIVWNYSSLNEELSYDWQINACDTATGEVFRIDHNTAALQSMFGAPRDSISLCVDGDTKKFLPPGNYLIYVTATYTDLLGNRPTVRADVGTITIVSSGASVTTEDAAWLECTAPTFTVSATASLAQRFNLGVELAQSDDFSDGVMYWYYDAPISHESVTVQSAAKLRNLHSNTTYYYRAILQIEGTDNVIYGESKQLVIGAMGHSLMHRLGKAPTCETDGWAEYDICSVCGYTTYQKLPALGHDYVATVTKAATCTEDGVMTYVCSHDESHTYTEPIPATGHDYVATVTEAATCTEDGVMTYTCSHDESHTYTEPIPATGHDYVLIGGTEATCETAGVAIYRCSRCGKVIHEYSPAGHIWEHHEAKAATCTEDGWNAYDVCTRCGETTKVVIPATGHDYVATVTTPPTCTTKGVRTYTCSHDASHTYTEEIPATGHDYTVIREEPTCTKAGYNYRYCTVCGDNAYEALPALGHDLVHHDAHAVSCTEDGWDAYDTCTRCSYSTQVVISAPGHNLVHHAAQTATYKQIGWDAYDECTRCGYSTYVEIPKIPYDVMQIVSASRSGDSINIELIKQTDANIGKLLLALYDGQGKMLAATIVEKTNNINWVLSAAVAQSAATVKAFALDGVYRPLCEARVRQLS